MVEVQSLLDLIQHYRFLYDKNCPAFRDAAKKANAWKEIARNLNTTEDAVKTRWRTLRERYSKELKNEENNQKSGVDVDEYSSTWIYFRNMSFLKSYMRRRRARNNNLLVSNEFSQDFNCEDKESRGVIADRGSSSSLSNVSMEDVVACSQAPSGSAAQEFSASSTRFIKKRKLKSDLTEELLNTLRDLDSKKEDEDDIFCKILAIELRKVTDPKEKQRIKAKLFLIALGFEKTTV